MNQVKIVSIIFLVIAILNLILFAVRLISDIVFWIVIIICAVGTYWLIPKLKK